MLYKKGPRYFHASYIVLVKTSDSQDYSNVNQLHGHYRISETSKKVGVDPLRTRFELILIFDFQELLIVEIHYPDHLKNDTDPIRLLKDLQSFRASEMTLKRFNFQQDH